MHNFLAHLYWTAAESMPAAPLTDVATGCATDVQAMRDELFKKLVHRQIVSACQLVSDLQPEKLPPRQLPPGTVAELFLMYVAYCRVHSQEPSSRSTFYEMWKQWRCCLSFRHRSEHSLCPQCAKLKAAIQCSKVLPLVFRFLFAVVGPGLCSPCTAVR